tara:strand:- start:2210 stop:3076 length:867 start_codon:yes stop_codon:yes gene_type:complete
MISVVGIGNAASKVVSKFSEIPQYDVYMLNSEVKKNSKYKHKLARLEDPEQCEQNVPDLKKFFSGLKKRVQVYIVGASISSNYSLGVLEQIKDHELDIVYIKPDTTLLSGLPLLMERAVFGVLQEYARSGLFRSFTIFSNEAIENSHPNINLKSYYDTLNETVFSTMHYINYFEHTEPHIGSVSKPAEVSKIRTVGMLNMKNLEENWLYELDTPRDLCYYMCINTDRLEKESGLHKRLVGILKNKPKNAFRKISYSIYETHLPDFGFCVAHTNVVQNNQTTLDKLEQE